jgi:hypothetical protein
MRDDFQEPAEGLKRLLDKYGAALIRGAVSPDVATTYLQALSEIYAMRDARDPRLDSCPREEVEALAIGGDVNAGVLETLTGLTMERYFATPLLKSLLGLCLEKPQPTLHTILTVSPNDGRDFKMHTDGIIQGTVKAVVAMWAPLHPCGVDAPGLSVIRAARPAVLRYLREIYPDKEIPGWSSATNWAREDTFLPQALYRAFGPVWHPEMEPGDVMVFTNWTIHGSHVSATMTKPRSAIIQRWIDDDWRR